MSVLSFDCRFAYPPGFALDLAFAAEAGVTALVGPSGCGKTTALNLIAGLLTPQDGVIRLGDETLFDSRTGVNLPPERRGVGYVFQDYMLFPHLSVEDNLRYGARRSSGVAVDFDKVVRELAVDELLPRSIASLSGGQKQRVAVGRALLRGPRLLLLDEPVSAVHEELRDSMSDFVIKLVREMRIATILVSHDRGSVSRLADATVSLGG
jgi:molybdate transport system ATP-binding protein